jgi:hypothetical protein
MKELRLVLRSTISAVLLLGISGCGVAKNTKVAETEVDRFHQRWKANEFQAVFDDAHMQFRAAQPAEKMTAILQSVKQNYGELKSTKKRSWGFSSDKGVDDIRLSYDSVFDHGSAVEDFTFRMAGDRALLLAYDIMTPETAAKREAKQKADAAEREAARTARKAEKKP